MHADTDQQQEPYKRYFRALSLLAKNDIFVEFGLNVLVEFYESLRAGLATYGDWDGAPETFEAATGRVFEELKYPSDFVSEVKRMLQVAGEVNTKKASAVPISLDDTLKMKTFCDAYFLVRARRYIHEMASKQSAGK
jgi:hypothetical protein